jgi:uncharacterized membrane protein required for colicin V production
MWLNVVALLILGAFVALGAVRGALTTGLGLLSLGVGYACGLLLGPAFGPQVSSALAVPSAVGVAVAGTGVFTVVYFAMGLLSAIVTRMARRRNIEPSARDRFLGGVFGLVRGGLIVVLVCWLAVWVDVLRATGAVTGVPEVGDSTAARVSSEIVESGLSFALKDAGPAGRVVARVAARPGVAVGEIEAILQDEHVEQLRGDAMFWSYVEHDNMDAARNRTSFRLLVRDAALRRRFADLGLVEQAAADDPHAFEAAMTEVLREVGPRIYGLKNDPELQRLMHDPEVVAMLQSGDTLGLLRHPGFQDLVERISAGSGSEEARAPRP